MKIGLVRHFRVKKDFPSKRVSSTELLQWFEEYDQTDIEAGECDLGEIAWQRCYSSNLSRALKTAHSIYPGEIIVKEELREIKPAALFRRNIKLPFMWWAILMKVAWYIHHPSQPETKADLSKRIQVVLDEILRQGDQPVLIVSHGALMMFIQKELLRRGFLGPTLKFPANGKLYVYEK